MPHTNDKESFIRRLTGIIDGNITNQQFGVNELAREVGMSRSNLHRRVKSTTGKSISTFIRDVRLEKAAQLLRESTGTISEIAFECGFQSATYFSKCFRDRYGFPPGEARNKSHESYGLEQPQHPTRQQRFGKRKAYIPFFIAALFIILILSIAFLVWRPLGGEKIAKYKSIAILPFINDSPEESEMYFINGTMEAILNNLSKIEDLRVISRTTVEQYRNHPQPLPEIAKDLGVSYILEGSGQRYGKMMQISVQLLDASKDSHIWTEEYDLEIDQIEELFNLQNKIAMMVVKKIHAEVSPDEMERMKKIPTTSEVAYEFYLKGNDILFEYFARDASSGLLTTSETLYRYALDYDAAFAAAFRQIATIYYMRCLTTPGKTEYWDSIKINLDRSLQFDPAEPESYELYGSYYRIRGNWDKAIEYFNLALDYNPNPRGIYANIGAMYANKNDYVNALTYLYKSQSNQPPGENYNVNEISKRIYLWAGFKEQYDHFAQITLKNRKDTARYYYELATAAYWIDDNRPKAMDLLEKSYLMDSTKLETLRNLGEVCLNDGQYARSLVYYEKFLDRLNELGRVDLYGTHNIGLAYWLNGDKQQAEHYFNLQISYCMDVLSGMPDSNSQLAAIYAFREDRELAYQYLREFNKQSGMNIYVKNNFRENHPYFSSIQDDPEYQSIRADILAKYQAEHERVRQWLEENESH